MAFARFGDVVHCSDVERHELLLVNWHKDCEVLLVDVELAFLKVRWKLFDGCIGLNKTHTFLFLFFSTELDFVIIESFNKVLKHFIKKLVLVLLDVNLLFKLVRSCGDTTSSSSFIGKVVSRGAVWQG